MKPLLPLFAVVWIGVVVLADVVLAYGIRTAIRSADWTPTNGLITRSELIKGRKGSVRLNLEYIYMVDGQPHTGHEYQPGPHLLPNQKWRQVHAEWPEGKPVTVYYDPDTPKDAFLNPGVKPDVLMVLLAFTPFNLVAVGLGRLCWGQFTGRREFDPVRDVRPTTDGYTVRLNGVGPLAVFGLSLFVGSFASIFLVLLGLHDFAAVPTSWLLDGSIWAAILAVCAFFAWRYRTPRELVEGSETLTLPTTPTGREMIEIPRSAVRNVEVNTTAVPNRKRPRTVHVVSLIGVDENQGRQITRFAEYAERPDAESLAEWLRERLNLT